MQILLALITSSSGQFAPHGYCFLWTPTLLWGMVVADLLIATAYFSIPIALGTFARKRGIGLYNHLLLKFGFFILLCGTTHLIYLWNIWHSHYYLEVTVKLLTGFISIYVAFYIWKILPEALKIPTINELEIRVKERTEELETSNALLLQRNSEREETLRAAEEANARLDAVFNSSPNGIIITNKKGIITEANPTTETMFGYLRSELIGQHVNMLTPSHFKEEHTNYINNANKRFNAKTLGFGRKLLAVRRYDRKFPIDIAITTIAHSENHYFMAVIRDLTEIDVVEEELRTVNEQLMATINNLKTQSQETMLLNEYTEMLQTCENFEEYPAIVSSYCESLFGAKTTDIYLSDGHHKLLSMNPESDKEILMQECWALKANKPYPLNERQREIPCKHLHGSTNYICVPLSAKGSLLGLIVFDHKDFIHEEEEKKLLEFEKLVKAFMVRTSICLANLKLLKEKELLSFKDELTGLYNRRFMNETMASYLPRAKREQVPVTVLMIDIDHFKSFNDNYGHNLGDTVLIQVAQCIENCMRETDLVCRLGGEEFLAVMYDATEEDGKTKANNIHDAIQKINNLPLPITVSIGVAQKETNDSVESLIRHADIALYDAKENGRDQTQSYTLHLKGIFLNQQENRKPNTN